MAGTFNTTFVTESKLKLLKLNYSAEIYAKCHLTNKLLNYDLILGRDILHELGLTLQIKRSLGKPPNCAAKEFFVMRESFPVQNATKRIKQILDDEKRKLT